MGAMGVCGKRGADAGGDGGREGSPSKLHKPTHLQEHPDFILLSLRCTVGSEEARR